MGPWKHQLTVAGGPSDPEVGASKQPGYSLVQLCEQLIQQTCMHDGMMHGVGGRVQKQQPLPAPRHTFQFNIQCPKPVERLRPVSVTCALRLVPEALMPLEVMICKATLDPRDSRGGTSHPGAAVWWCG